MCPVWVLLAKTLFPFQTWQTWQTSEQAHRAKAEIAVIPFDVEMELLEPDRRQVHASLPLLAPGDLICSSPKMKTVVETVFHVAPTNATVLILGETGVGKTRIASLIHERSPRSQGPFVRLNCGAVPQNLMESELFGYVRGAFTGAVQARRGLIEAAQGGTFFLDEVAELALEHQVKLLKVLEDRRVRRLGKNEETLVDVRIIAATNQPVERLMREGRLRRDLYYRLAKITLDIPPLRCRREDIAPLIDHVLEKENRDLPVGRVPVRLAARARRRLLGYAWPGNVRELENVVGRLVIEARAEVVQVDDVEAVLPPQDLAEAIGTIDVTLKRGRGLKEIVRDVELRLINMALEQHGTQEKAAKALGLATQQTLSARITRLKKTHLS